MERLYTPEEAAEYAHVSPRTVRDWLRVGSLRGTKLSKEWLILEQDLTAFVMKKREDTSNEVH